MFKKLLRYLCVLAMVFSLSFNSAAAIGDEDLSGKPNPDSANISGTSGDETITVKPRNDADDFRNLQWAVDNVKPGGTVRLEPGTFFLGDGKDSPRETVAVRKGMRIVGKKEGGAWLSIVRGGGAMGIFSGTTQLESGAFRIMNEDDDHPVVFEDIWLREWACEAILIEACQGFTIRGCRISHPVNTALNGMIRFVHSIWTTGSRARGDFTAENNLVELGGYEGELADDEQMMGVFYSNHDTVRVVNNVITGIDEAIEIIGNRYDEPEEGGLPQATGPAKVIVTGNKIDVTPQPGQRWPSTFAILVAGNLGADETIIKDNDLTVHGGTGFVFGLSGENVTVADNKIRLEEFEGKYPRGVVTIGFGALGGRRMGYTLNDSVFENNTFEGKVSGVGIVFNPSRGDNPNDSHGNRFDLGDSLAKLGAKATLTLNKDMHDNTFSGNLEPLVDNSPDGANKY